MQEENPPNLIVNEVRDSPYQQAIYDHITKTKQSLVVIAKAGSGKTTTIVKAAKLFPEHQRSLFVAFNKSIADELKERLPKNVHARTLHSAGYYQVRRMFSNVKLDTDKGKNIAKEMMAVFLEQNSSLPQALKEGLHWRQAYKLASLSKSMLAQNSQDVINIGKEFMYDIVGDIGAEFKMMALHHIADITGKILNASIRMNDSIDYDDMIFFPWHFKMKSAYYDNVIVDEAQDMNPAQLWLARSMVRTNGRMIIVGDNRQAIYGWRGAHKDALKHMISSLCAARLPLSVTYRCPKKVVQLAQEFVPDFEWAPNAKEGIINEIPKLTSVEPGSFIISRTNAPLVKACLSCLSQNIPAIIMGRDISEKLTSLVKKSKKKNIDSLSTWLEAYKNKETEKIIQNFDDEDKAKELIETVTDTVMCLKHLSEGLSTCAQLTARIDSLFTDDNAENIVICGTVHKLKGLERNTVYVLKYTFSPKDKIEEANIWYVAITRTKNTLYLVGSFKKKDSKPEKNNDASRKE